MECPRRTRPTFIRNYLDLIGPIVYTTKLVSAVIYAPKNIFWRHLAKTNPGKLLMKGRLIIIAPFPKNVNHRNNIFFRFVVQNRRKTYPVTMEPTVYPKKPAVHTRLIVSVKKQRLKPGSFNFFSSFSIFRTKFQHSMLVLTNYRT